MQLEEFRILRKSEKAIEVWTNGVFLCSKSFAQKKYNLYALDDFFVEMLYDANNSAIIVIRSFRSNRSLEPYLSQIELGSL